MQTFQSVDQYVASILSAGNTTWYDLFTCYNTLILTFLPMTSQMTCSFQLEQWYKLIKEHSLLTLCCSSCCFWFKSKLRCLVLNLLFWNQTFKRSENEHRLKKNKKSYWRLTLSCCCCCICFKNILRFLSLHRLFWNHTFKIKTQDAWLGNGDVNLSTTLYYAQCIWVPHENFLNFIVTLQ